MFDARNGFFHFVFANPDDDFYTPSFLKLKRIPFLRYQIRMANPKFRFVYLFREKEINEKGEYFLEYFGEKSRNAIVQENTVKTGFLDSIREKFFGTEKAPELEETEFSDDYLILHEAVTQKQTEEKFSRILNLMLTDTNVCAAMPVSLFYDIMKENAQELRSKLAKLRKQNRNHAVILFSDADCGENDTFFIDPYYQFPSGNLRKPDVQNVFQERELFPEADKILDTRSGMPLCLFYEQLQESLGERMQVWTAANYDCLYPAVFSFLVRNTPPEAYHEIPDAAVLAKNICCWYQQPITRDSYYQIPLKNETYEIWKVLQLLDDRAVCRNIADMQVSAEQNQTVTLFRNQNDTILILMQQYRELLRKLPEAEEILSKQEQKKLLFMISDFEKPGFAHRINVRRPAWLDFQEYENEYAEYLRYLADRKEVNPWDCGGIRLLYVLFAVCYADALESKDFNHLRCQNLVQTGADVLKYFKAYAAEQPDDHKSAAQKTARQEELFRSGSASAITQESYRLL